VPERPTADGRITGFCQGLSISEWRGTGALRPVLGFLCRTFGRMLRRRMISRTLRDVLDGHPSLPSVRGLLYAQKMHKRILEMPCADLLRIYPEYQRSLIATVENGQSVFSIRGLPYTA